MDNYHHHARTTVCQRKELAMSVTGGRLSLKEAAAEFKLSRQSAAKWVRHFREAGEAGLRDRTCCPRCSRRLTPAELVVRVEAHLRQRWTGMRIARPQPGPRSGIPSASRALRTSRSAPLQAGLHGHVSGPAGVLRGPLPGRHNLMVPALRHPHPPHPHRQRTLLCRQTLPQHLPGSRPKALQNQALHAVHQRQGRTLHPDRPERMGLCQDLSKLTGKNRRADILHPPIQLAQTIRQPQPTSTHPQSQNR